MRIDSKLKKQLVRFFFAGITAVLVDFLVYIALLQIIDYVIAKAIGFISGTIVAFVLNKYWTFEDGKFIIGQPLRFALLYTITFFANGVVNYGIKELYKNTLIAFLVATAVSTVLNFVGQKYWVFKS